MPYFKTSTEWYEQSSLLLKARPTTVCSICDTSSNPTTSFQTAKALQVRITSKYTVLKPSASKIKKRENYAAKRAQKASESKIESSTESQPQNPEEVTATFKLKTYDPVSGTCLQYSTDKAAEVGRLIGSLGRLGRHMAALPEIAEDLSIPAEASGIATPVKKDDDGDVKVTDIPKAAGSGGGKKKRKGKK
jgi:hypothetical protein